MRRANTIWFARRQFSSGGASRLSEGGKKKYVFVQAGTSDHAVQAKAEELSDRFDLTLLDTDHSPSDDLSSYGVLQVQPQRLQFCYFITRKNRLGFERKSPLAVFYTDMNEFYTNSPPLHRRSPLLRAMIETEQSTNNDSPMVSDESTSLAGRNILDGSAGLGVDAFSLARQGAHVTMVEKSPIVHCLLHDGLERAKQSCSSELGEILDRMELWPTPEDCNNVFSSDMAPDIIYLDMLHHVKKKSEFWKTGFLRLHLPRVITGSPTPEEAYRTLARAREFAKDRVVEKVPYYAELGDTPSLGPFKTRNWRCNVFLRTEENKE